MAGRQNQGGFKGFATQVAALPWWLALALAVLSYVACHALAGMTVEVAEQPTAQIYIKTLASALQYLLPLLFTVAAGLSVYGRRLQAQRPVMTETPPIRSAPRPPARRSSGTSTYMACPKCGSLMVPRTVEEGPDAGKSYWGCTKAPLCQETLSL